jgi:hypothetical protein
VCSRILSLFLASRFSLLASEMVSIYTCEAAGVTDTSLNRCGFYFRGNSLLMYALSHKYVYNFHLDNDAFTALIVAETLPPSRCLAMDARSDSDIPAFRRHVTIFFFK